MEVESLPPEDPGWFAYILFKIFLPSILIFIISTLILAAFGKSLGVRRVYVQVLLMIFEYARQVSQSHEKERLSTKYFVGGDAETEDDDDDERLPPAVKLSLSGNGLSKSVSSCLLNQEGDKQLKLSDSNSEGCFNDSPKRLPRLISRHNVISRKDNLILQPDPQLPNGDHLSVPCDTLDGGTLHSETDLDHRDCGDTVEIIKMDVSNTSEDEPVKDLKRKTSDEIRQKVLGAKVLSANTFQREFSLSDVLDYVKTGVACIIEDEVTHRFEAEELKSWNLLTRTNDNFKFISWKLTTFWALGCFWRYCILLPGRIAILLVGLLYMAMGMSFVGPLKPSPFKTWLNHWVTTSCFQVLGGAVSMVITYHDTENRPKSGICVANHTSPIDVLALACDRDYAFTGQIHGGFLGYVQRQLSRASPQIWFERGESKDREYVHKRLREHVDDPDRLPICIFPEGTCINNTSVMQFKKGSFEVGGVVYPVAIKYDAKFGDAFWNSSKFSMVPYLITMMTSWAIVCDVWYLPPMRKKEDEDAIDFANRVKKCIALKGGLVDLVWDGNLKRQQVKSEWKQAQQEQFSRRIKVD